MKKRGNIDIPTPAEVLLEQGRQQGIAEILDKLQKEGKLDGREEGKIEGIREGELKSTREAIVEFLEFRFGNISKSTVEQLSGVDDIRNLRELRNYALRVFYKEQFEWELNRLI